MGSKVSAVAWDKWKQKLYYGDGQLRLVSLPGNNFGWVGLGEAWTPREGEGSPYALQKCTESLQVGSETGWDDYLKTQAR